MPCSCALLDGFAIGARVALLWQHYGNAWQSPAVIRQAHRTTHACRTRTLRMPPKTPLAGDKIDAPAACAVPFHPYCGGVAMRTRNVSEYMLVLPLCLVTLSVIIFVSIGDNLIIIFSTLRTAPSQNRCKGSNVTFLKCQSGTKKRMRAPDYTKRFSPLALFTIHPSWPNGNQQNKLCVTQVQLKNGCYTSAQVGVRVYI